MDREDKEYIDLGLLGCDDEDNSVLTEASRTTLLSKSKSADKYANGKGSRWTQKAKCSVASTVKDYNKIDMNTFWKNDKLTFGVKVAGESGDYIVTISFDHILDKIQRKIHDNKQLLEFKCIYDALIQAINTGDVKISCTCLDYKYRLKYWNSESGDEAGTKETRKADTTNPNNSKGPACKHILAVLNNVEWLNKVASVINNYANYCKENMEYNYSKYIFPKLYGMDYKKAVQMTLDDYDEEGNVKGDLKSDEELINLSNALGKVRGRIKKGSNRNPAAKKKEESLEEDFHLVDLDEAFTNPIFLQKHYDSHCESSPNYKRQYDEAPFTRDQVKNIEDYKEFAEWFANQPVLTSPRMHNNVWFSGDIMQKVIPTPDGKRNDILKWCKIKEQTVDKVTKIKYDLNLFVVYFETDENDRNPNTKIIRTFYKSSDRNIHKSTLRDSEINLNDYKNYKKFKY